jgi:DNA polymerase I-like protein with 3'-5' exonuclease and polymerase domains
MLLQHLLFPDFPHDLEFVASQFLSKPAWKSDKSVLETYCCRDTDVTLCIANDVIPRIKKLGLESLYHDVQVPLGLICKLMHDTGFKTDPNRIKAARAKLLEEMELAEQQLPDHLRTRTIPTTRRMEAPIGTRGKSGQPVKYVRVPSSKQVVPWRSPTAKQRYLYTNDEGCLGLDPVHDPKSGRVTTGKLALDKLYGRTKNPALRALRRLNQLDELVTTFAKEDMVRAIRQHPHFNVHGTASGRLSSSDPNLQNIPETTRYIYVPSEPGWKIVDVDYSQIENRLTAYFAGDTERLRRFKEDPKFSEHRYAASLFLGIPYEDVVKDNDKDAPYGKAKRIVHGTNYGMGYKKIANTFDMDYKETKRLQDLWKGAIKATTLWQMRIGEEAKRRGVLTTPFGRKRWFWTSSTYTEALSFLPQSTAADILFRAMLGLMWKRIGWTEEQVSRVAKIHIPLPEPARLLISVHDSLVFECPSAMVGELVGVVRSVMEQPWKELSGMVIPIGVKVGDSWGDSEDYVL